MPDHFHYPPEIMSLLIEVVPVLCRSKKDVILFFKGAGVDHKITDDIEHQVIHDKQSINKYEICREIITRLNEKGESALRERRVILKRITEYEDFSTCWPDDQLKAKGLVSEIRRVVNVKDSFTRMQIARENEISAYKQEYLKKQKDEQRKRDEISKIKDDLFSLFKESNANKRGKLSEHVLNRLFKAYDISVREDFTLTGSAGEGIIEQIDGVVEIDGQIYLVEMKWHSKNLGPEEVSPHLVRIFNRGVTRGILISNSDYTQAALSICKEALTRTVIVLCKLKEFVYILDREKDLRAFLKDSEFSASMYKTYRHEGTNEVVKLKRAGQRGSGGGPLVLASVS